MNQTYTQWPAGWTPNADAVNGNPQGLVRMDNLCLDAQGVLALIEGITQLGQNFIDYVSDMFSLNIGGTEYLWISVNMGAAVFRTTLPALTGQVNMAVSGAGTPSARACFGACLGQTLAFAGQMRTKDIVGGNQWPLGILTPGGTFGFGTAKALSQSTLAIAGSGTVIQEGTDNGSTGTSVQVTVDPNSLEGIGVLILGGIDTTNIGGLQSSNLSTDLFEFTFSLDFPNPSAVNTLNIQILLDPNPSDPTGYQNYYTYSVDTSANGTLNFSLLSGPDVASQITVQRGQFTRVGSNSLLDWTTVQGIRVTCQCTATASFYFYNIAFVGGSLGQLNGVYNYIQVNANNNGQYVALSPPSKPFICINPNSPSANNNDVNVINGAVVLTPAATLGDQQVNEQWYFRIASSDVGLTDTGASANSSSLGQYYFVGKSTSVGATFTDSLSDDEIIEIGITLNAFLQTLRSGDANGISDNIFGCEGLIFGRMLYMGTAFLYLSDFLNPDAVDSRYTIKPSGDANEKNLFIRKIANGSLILATTRDLYEVTGTFNPLPNGTIDVTLIPIGDAYPPLSQDHVQTQGGIFYVASDGIRFTTGQHSQNVSPLLQYLFQGQIRHNVPPFLIQAGNSARYAITAGHNRIYASIPCVDGTRRLIIYDVNSQLYYLRYTDPVALHVTPNGEVLAGYEISFNPNIDIGAVYQYESGQGINYNGGQQGYQIYFTTVFDSNGQPRNRKDTFTLKLILDTGGSSVSVYIQKDGIGVTDAGAQTWVLLGNVSANGQTTVYFPLNPANVTLGFRYAFKIVDVNLVTTFKLYELTMEYDPRPEQLDYLRIQPSNLGTISRKRIVNYAFVIDTLGNNITFTPYIDNSNTGIEPASSVVNTPAKQTYIHYFIQEQIGTDINGILSGGVFEFYGLNDQEIISEKMPVPVKFLVIPANNYGTPNRKRHTSFKFQINTRGSNVIFTPILDGVAYPSQTFNTTIKLLVEYFFTSTQGDVSARDIGGILASSDDSTPFEFYGVVTPQQIEQLPDRLLYFVIPVTDYGTPNRKRHTSYKFSINTNGEEVVFTPYLDGTAYDTLTFATSGRRTVEYFFNTADGDIIGIDVGGTLAAQTSTPFEFYGTVVPQQVETLPPRLEFFRIPNNNFGIAARKRVRTLPIVIDTYGYNVTFTPIVDGTAGTPTVLNTIGKTTTYHFFDTDVFGTDFGGTLSDSVNPFEFYEMGTPENVETLPVPKQYDQLGPVRFDRIGKIFNIRMRLITNGSLTSIPLTIYGDNNPSNPSYAGTPLYNTVFTVVPQTDQVYEIQLPKSINTTMCRITLGPFAPSFHRYDMQIRVSQSGMETDAQWLPVR